MKDEAKADNPKSANTPHPRSALSAISAQAGPTMPLNPAWRLTQPFPWPHEPDQTSPLAWWRRLPPDSFRDAERSLLLATLERVRVLRGSDDLTAALGCDPAAAIEVAFSLMPIETFTLEVDIAMTALARCALKHNAAASLVMA